MLLSILIILAVTPCLCSALQTLLLLLSKPLRSSSVPAPLPTHTQQNILCIYGKLWWISLLNRLICL